MEQYKNREATYVLRSFIKEFIKLFYKGLIQGHSGAIGLMLRL